MAFQRYRWLPCMSLRQRASAAPLLTSPLSDSASLARCVRNVQESVACALAIRRLGRERPEQRAAWNGRMEENGDSPDWLFFSSISAGENHVQ
eukprot:scaffold7346_cov245-Pinguiococcus_pyrenoidosus.AAC.21